MARIFFDAGAVTRPVPRGAGMRRTETEPHLFPKTVSRGAAEHFDRAFLTKRASSKRHV